jgi:hypothetical protein
MPRRNRYFALLILAGKYGDFTVIFVEALKPYDG